MPLPTLILAAIVFALALWLGLYLIARDSANRAQFLAGCGLLAYAAVWGLDTLHALAPGDLLGRLRWPFQCLPALCWSGAALALLPEDFPPRHRLERLWRFAILPVGAALCLAGAVGLLGADPTASLPSPGVLIAGAILLAPLFVAAALIWRERGFVRPLRANAVLLIAILFFGLGTAALLFGSLGLPRFVSLLLVDADLVFLGLAIAALDAFDQGEALLPDLLRSLTFAGGGALLFGGQVALAIALGPGVTVALAALLLAVVATATATSVFADPLGGLLDRLALGRQPQVVQARAELRATATALPRANPALDPATLDDAEFARLTRRALSHVGDLPRLAVSPLVHLPLIDQRLVRRHAPDEPLERAAELKALLGESIDRLKPRASGDFSTADEWRHYNALYFPYVIGLKPYSTRAVHDKLDPAARAALDWFQATIPERTLHNWQNAAAKLIAQDLRARHTAQPD